MIKKGRNKMRFVHIADMHFDSPFSSLNRVANLGDKRRLEQREVFSSIITYIKEEKIPYFFIAGDLYEQEYIKKSTIQYLNEQFKRIPNTRIFIAPGNHDPYLKNSYYAQYKWQDNVHIFGSQLERIETEEAVIYGYGFDDFYCRNCGIESWNIKEQKPSILVMHGSVDSGKSIDQEYNPIASRILEQSGFDYIALGHIHKKDCKEEQCWCYPGSTISLGFDELGKHGMVVGNVEKEKREITFVPMDPKEFKELTIDIGDIVSEEELVEKIKTQKYQQNELYKVILAGKRKMEINPSHLFSLLDNPLILKIKDETELGYSLSAIAREETLKGLFVKELLETIKENPEQKEKIEKAIQYGLESLEG